MKSLMGTGDRKKIIGLVGGIGSGKTTVAGLFKQLGAEVISADPIAHRVLNSPKVRARIVHTWGEDVLDLSGKIDHARLAERVFTRPKALNKLNMLIHPRVSRIIDQRLSRFRAKGILVLDLPLLFESKYKSVCRWVIYVHAPLRLRYRRLKGSRDWTLSELRAREHRQIPLKKKRASADYVIDNSGPLKDTKEQIKRIYFDISKFSRGGRRWRLKRKMQRSNP
jgi:dephospho-CoA kinase